MSHRKLSVFSIGENYANLVLLQILFNFFGYEISSLLKISVPYLHCDVAVFLSLLYKAEQFIFLKKNIRSKITLK